MVSKNYKPCYRTDCSLGKAQPKPQRCDNYGEYLPTVTLDKHSPHFSDDKITTRGESRVTLGGLRWKVKRDEGCPYRSRSRVEMRPKSSARCWK
jgi:hypothetical protein